jgi:Flp pilus assembly protein protease CpaA
MPWKLIQFIILFAVFLFFIGFNLENKCDIKFGTEKMVLKDVPVYFTVFCSFIIGMLCALPFVLSFRSRRKANAAQGKGLLAKMTSKNKEEQTKAVKENPDSVLFDKNNYGID